MASPDPPSGFGSDYHKMKKDLYNAEQYGKRLEEELAAEVENVGKLEDELKRQRERHQNEIRGAVERHIDHMHDVLTATRARGERLEQEKQALAQEMKEMKRGIRTPALADTSRIANSTKLQQSRATSFDIATAAGNEEAGPYDSKNTPLAVRQKAIMALHSGLMNVAEVFESLTTILASETGWATEDLMRMLEEAERKNKLLAQLAAGMTAME